jgi:hypothetical protein
MTDEKDKRFPERVLKRYADLVLHHIYQCGGRQRYVPLVEIEDALGLEQPLILHICGTHLLGEVHVAERPPAELEESEEYCSPVDRELMREMFARPHIRIRPDAVRLTQAELISSNKRCRAAKKMKGRRRN